MVSKCGRPPIGLMTGRAALAAFVASVLPNLDSCINSRMPVVPARCAPARQWMSTLPPWTSASSTNSKRVRKKATFAPIPHGRSAFLSPAVCQYATLKRKYDSPDASSQKLGKSSVQLTICVIRLAASALAGPRAASSLPTKISAPDSGWRQTTSIAL
eukprot:5925332-Prymnesium_polylepis.2